MSLQVTDEKFTQLIQEIEKVRRRKVIDFNNPNEIQYLDPFDNLGKIKISNNHLILGRRGCGKTTLLLTTIKENNSDFILPLDCQVYREWNSEKIIIEVLQKFLDKLKIFILESEAFKKAEEVYKEENKGIFNWFKNLGNDKKISDYEKFLWLISNLKNLYFYLDKLKELPNEPIAINIKQTKKKFTKLEINSSSELKAISKFNASGNVPIHFTKLQGEIELLAGYQRNSSRTEKNEEENSQDLAFIQTIDKREKLDDLILSISDSLGYFSELTGNKTVLFLDDFYLVELSKQPRIVQYLHDIYKNAKLNSFCFKLCSIPNRTRINKENKADFSFKDDFSPIRLDKELYDFANLKDYLLKITANLSPALGLNSNDILGIFSNDDVLNFTTVATGGVPRDFLVILSELIKIARSENAHKIKKEHLYSAISDLKQDKEQNIEIESDIPPEKLREALEIIENEIVKGLKTNVILYPAQLAKEHNSLLKNLVNLRYLHIINDSTSSDKIKKEIFVSYLVDMTFYATGRRLKPGFDFREFWYQDSSQRHKHLRNAPIWHFKNEVVDVEVLTSSAQRK
ncbi:hypothetical protein ACXYMT_05150 [Salinimicrobium sp. CAU 1759]